jgi:dTMP kinase
VTVNRGPLIAFEGIDGSGKSTQIRMLADRLDAAGIAHVVTYEPTDGVMGRRIRDMARSGEAVAPELELEWFMADRAEHVRDLIEPACARGEWVLTDRYYLSTVAYQGARGLDAEAILAESEARFPAPELTLVFEIEPRRGLERVTSRGGVAEPVFEELGFLERVAGVFARIERPDIVRLDADRTESEVAADVRLIVSERMGVDLDP